MRHLKLRTICRGGVHKEIGLNGAAVISCIFKAKKFRYLPGPHTFYPYLVSEWLVYCEHLAHRLLDASRNAVHEPKRLTHDPGQSLG